MIEKLAKNAIFVSYYRYHNGGRLLSPARQKEIIDFIGGFGSTDGLEFDNVLQYDFT